MERVTSQAPCIQGRASAARSVLLGLIDQGVTDARIRFLVQGSAFDVGRADEPSRITIRVHRERMFARVLGYGNLGLGESYMEGDFDVETGTLHEFLTALLRNHFEDKIRGDWRLALRVLAIRLANLWRGAPANVRLHYDLGDDLFEAFLDSTLTYSCGYVLSAEDGLEALQQQKLERICRKLRLTPGTRILDIGCGFGGLLIHAARYYGARGTGVTLSHRHGERAKEQVRSAGLADSITIERGDFSCVKGTSERLVSVGMMEHLSPGDYRRFFTTVAERVTPTGLGLLHTIGSTVPGSAHDPFIQRYVFPCSHQPRLSRIAEGLERHRMAILDVENIKSHYGYTALRWLERFQDHQECLDAARYDRVFRRMWEYYLSCGVAAASASDAAVFQVLFARDHTAPTPLHRT